MIAPFLHPASPYNRLPHPLVTICRVIAFLLVLLLLFFVGVLTTVGPVGAVDSHFTHHPENIPSFVVGAWQKTNAEPHRYYREATLPTFLYTLRYTTIGTIQADGSILADEEGVSRYDADLRWGRLAPILIAWCLLIWSFWSGIPRLLQRFFPGSKLDRGFPVLITPESKGSRTPSSASRPSSHS